MATQTLYSPAFYARLTDRVEKSAAVSVPLIQDLLAPRKVVDVGCGQGEWLRAFMDGGVPDVAGVDGAYVLEGKLHIPTECFHAHDLTQPFRLPRKYDVALCLEVGEHLPRRAAPTLVETLVRLAPAIVFSAAVPGQGGVHHINEQWPWYWQELFARHGFVRLDPFRKQLWQHPEVLSYYQTNLFLFVDPATHQGLIDQIGIPDRISELTLIRTTILQEMTSPGLLKRALSSVMGLVGIRPGP